MYSKTHLFALISHLNGPKMRYFALFVTLLSAHIGDPLRVPFSIPGYAYMRTSASHFLTGERASRRIEPPNLFQTAATSAGATPTQNPSLSRYRV